MFVDSGGRDNDSYAKLFDQDCATEAYGRELERIGEMKGAVNTYQEMGTFIEKTTKKGSAYIKRSIKVCS